MEMTKFYVALDIPISVGKTYSNELLERLRYNAIFGSPTTYVGYPFPLLSTWNEPKCSMEDPDEEDTSTINVIMHRAGKQ
jgi:hypothetical protein